MGKKKKKKKGARKGQPDSKLTFKQLLVKGGQLLSQGDARGAVTHLRLAEKKAGRTFETDRLLFAAYLARRKQLAEKGMVSEATAMARQACEYFPGAESVEEPWMAAYLECLEDDEAIGAYARYLEKRGPSATAERVLADRILSNQRWDRLERLAAETPLVRDGLAARKAADLAMEGRWEDASRELAGVARTSPFAPFRMLCRAMGAFCDEDDRTAQKALSMIPEDFFLAPFVRAMRTSISPAAGKVERRDAMLAAECLWDGPIMAERMAAELVHELSHKKPQACAGAISSLAETIFPEDPESAAAEILQILWKPILDDSDSSLKDLLELSGEILPPERVKLLFSKLNFFEGGDPLRDAAFYIDRLGQEFPDEEDERIARALILQHVVEKNLDNVEMFFARGVGRPLERKFDPKVLGIRTETAEMVPIEMLSESIRLDPGARKSYELVAGLRRETRDAKNAVEKAFLAMMETFPDDPYPCLELADLYYSKNAFRKAENILQEAMKRAPHDNRVLDRCALGFAISADKNFKRGKYHLSWPDFERAAEAGRPQLAELLGAKRAVHRIVADGCPVEDALEEQLSHLRGIARSRACAIALYDLERPETGAKKASVSSMEKTFRKEVKLARKLPSSELKALLGPLEKHQMILAPALSIGKTFLDRDKKLLKKIDDRDFPFVADVVLHPQTYRPILDELERRQENAGRADRPILRFYRIVVHQLSVNSFFSMPFYELLTEIPKEQMPQVKEAARRLAPLVQEPMRKALSRFDFRLLDGFGSMFPGFGSPFPDFGSPIPDFEDWEAEEDEFDEEDEIWRLMDMLEGIVGLMDLESLSDSKVRAMGNEFRNDPEGKVLGLIADEIRPFADELSRKTQIFLYGKPIA